MAKLKFEDVEWKMKELHPDIELMQDFFVDKKTRMKCRCNLCGHFFEKTWDEFRQGSSCPHCASSNNAYKKALPVEFVKERLKKINPNIDVVSTRYLNDGTYVECVCVNDGERWEAAWENLYMGQICPKCEEKTSRSYRRESIDSVREKVSKISPTIEVLERIYIKSKPRILCKCKNDEHVWWAYLVNIYKGRGCPECTKLSISKVRTQLKEISPNIEILSKDFKGSRAKLKLRCLIDGYEWDSTWHILRENHGCPKCAGNANTILNS